MATSLMNRPFRFIGSIVPFIFATLSFSFIIAAFVSRDWVRQDYFPRDLSILDWRDPSYTLYRSPFVYCGINATQPDSNTTIFSLNCQRFSVYGRGRTACQTPNETIEFGQVSGDVRMCQQVHFSGNLILSSLVFICIAFALILPLTAIFAMQARTAEERNEAAAEAAAAAAAASASKTGEGFDGEQSAGKRVSDDRPIQRFTAIRSPLLIVMVYSVLTLLSATAVCAVLSQFYAVLGLVQSQADNGMYASLSLGEVQNQQTGDLHHAPWVQGDALTIFVSLGWFFSALAAGGIGASWLGRL